jgi:serine/threonine protein kinase
MSELAEVGVRPGDVLAGKYRVERVLGAGGMGVVVAAHHIALDEKVALKFLLPGATRSEEAVSRFVREARAAVKIKSEHVARVTDVGELEDGSPYMVMEYLEGRDLAAWLEERGTLPIEQAVDFLLQTCEALADAHSLGIVHRDLKPANLFCIERSDGQLSIKVLDFGISKITTPGAPGHDMTRTTAIMGSPPYMSPEQMKQSKGVDARADIWSLGIILFQVVTGRLPFDADAITELAIKVANEPAPPLRALRPDAPSGLAQVVATCLEKDREKRFQNVGELALALGDFGPKSARISVERVVGTLRKAGISGAVLPPSGELGPDPASAPPVVRNTTQTAASWGRTGAGTRSRKRAALGLAVVVALGGVAGAGAMISRGTSSRAPRFPVASISSAIALPAAEAGLQAFEARPPPAASPVDLPTAGASHLPTASPQTAPASAAPKSAPRPGRTTAGSPGGTPFAARPPASSSPAPAPSCSPPYVIDPAGHREYKPACLN